MIFTAADYARLHALVFRDDYPGYRPTVAESPNGDGKLDTQKRYAHVATKYLPGEDDPFNEDNKLWPYLEVAFKLARATYNRWLDEEMCLLPRKFAPDFDCGALRILEYPAGVGAGHVHTDFDLFTINCYRNVPNPGLGTAEVHIGELGELLGMGKATPHSVAPLEVVQHSIVYFAIPDHAAVLPSGQSVGEWIAERMGRSRYDVK